jgi:PKD repeat protein
MRGLCYGVAAPAVVLAVVLSGMLPGIAQATTITLYAAPAGTGSTCTQGAPCSFSTALGEANTLGNPGTIDLAAGTYTASSVSTDANSATGAWLVTNVHSEPISLVGAGEGSTIINTSGSASTTAGTLVLDLTGEDSGGATVSGLTVQIPDESGDDGVASVGPSVPITVSNVAIDGAAGLTGSTGLREASATVDNVTIALPQVGPTCTPFTTCNEGWYQANGPANATGLTVTADEGVDVNLDTGSFSDLRVFADVSGVTLSSGASSSTTYPFTESEIVMSGASSQALSLDDNNGTGTLVAMFDTITDSSASGTTGVVSMASNSGSYSNIGVSDSVVWGFAKPLWCDAFSPGFAEIATFYSDLATAGDQWAGPGCTALAAPGNINANPDFVTQANGDQTLAFNSPAIDAGDPTITGPLTDLDGNPRPVNTGGVSRVDMGAFEYQGWRGPTAVATAGTSSVVLGTPATFTATGSSDRNSLALVDSWHFDDGSTASGATVQHTFTTFGIHKATLTVTNALGLTSTTTAQVTVVAAAPPTPTVARAGSASVSGTSARERISCTGASGAMCSVKVTLAVNETVKGGKVVAVSASAHVKAKKRTVTVGTASITLGAGQSATLAVRLNGQGQRLLKGHPVLPVKLTARSGTHVLHSQVLRFKRVKHKAG